LKDAPNHLGTEINSAYFLGLIFLGFIWPEKRGVAGRHGFPFYRKLSVKSWGFVKLFWKKNL